MDDLTHNSEIGKATSWSSWLSQFSRFSRFSWQFMKLLLGIRFRIKQISELAFYFLNQTVRNFNPSDNIPGKLFPGHYIPTQKYYVDTIRVQSLPSKILFFHACSPPPPPRTYFCQYVSKD